MPNLTVVSGKLLAGLLFLLAVTGWPSVASPGGGLRHTRKDIYTRFVNLSARDGLAANQVYNMLMDRYGVMWFAGPGGLTRYDGCRFKVYRHEDGSGLPDSRVTALAEDAAGGLWIGTQKGLVRYDRTSGRFEPFAPRPGNDRTPILALCGDRSGFLWVETPGGHLDRLEISSGRWTHALHSPASSEGDYHYHHITADSKGNIWIGGRNQALVLAPKGKIEELCEPFVVSDDAEKRKCDTRCVVETSSGEILVGNKSRNALRYNPVDGMLQWIGEMDVDQTCAVRGADGRLWFGGSNGLEVVDSTRNEAVIIRHNPADPSSLISDAVYCLYCDPQGRIWTGTDRGVSLWSGGLNAVRHYRRIPGQEEGLSSDAVTALMQDRDGLLWVGTVANGVDTLSLTTERFGNLSFRLLRNDLDRRTFSLHRGALKQYARHGLVRNGNGQPVSERVFDNYDVFRRTDLRFADINENMVSALCQDSRGKVYIGLWSFAGFNIYDKRTDVFLRHALWGCPPGDLYPRLLGGNPFGSNWYTDFLEDSGGNFWCATWEGVGLNLFDRARGEFSTMHYMPANRPGTFCRQLAFDPVRGRVFAGGETYYGYYDPAMDDWSRYGGRIPAGFPNREIFEGYYSHCKAILKDLPVVFRCSGFVLQRDTAWVLSRTALLRHTLADDSLKEFVDIEEDRYLRLAAGAPGRLWFADEEGAVFRMDTHSGHTAQVVPPGEWLTALCEDNAGVLWVGTGSGLRRFDVATGKRHAEGPDIAKLTGISCVACLGRRVYVAHSTGVRVFDAGKQTGYYNFGQGPGELPGVSVRDIRAGSGVTAWICTDDGLAHIDAMGKIRVFRHNPADGSSLPDNNVSSVCEDNRGGVWVTTAAGIWRLDTVTGIFSDKGGPDERTLSSRLALCLAQDNLGCIWVGTDGSGISLLDRNTGLIRHLKHHTWDTGSISGNHIADIMSNNGSVWIASDGGVDRYDQDTGDIRHIGGLDAAGVACMVADRDGNVWMGGHETVSCVDPYGKILLYPSPLPGLRGVQFDKAACLLDDGRLALGGNGGFCVFDPATLLASEKTGSISFSNLKVNGSLRRLDLGGVVKMTLRYSENSFTVDFGGTGYESGTGIYYRYRLEGFDREWVVADAPALTARYTNLPPGRYILHVEASDAFGRPGAATGELMVHVATPWYRKWWFLVLITILAGGAVVATIRLRENKLRRDKTRLETLVGLRTSELEEANLKLQTSEAELRAMNDSKNRFFGIISHDLRNPLRALDLTARQLDEQYDTLPDERKQAIIRTIHQTAGQTGALLDNLLLWVVSQMGMIKANIKLCGLQELADAAIDPLRLSASEKGVSICNRIQGKLWAMVDANLLQTVLRNLVANAVKHSYTGMEVEISACKVEGAVEISVTDHGTGIAPEHMATLFTPGTRLKRRGTAGEQGSGLGLIIVREFIHLQGGEIRAESTPGHGSTFTVTLKTNENDLYPHC